VPWPEARGSSSASEVEVGGYATLDACFDWVQARAFLVGEMVVTAFARLVRACRSRQASCLELCNPQHPSTTL
jgi:hypothetical protein